MTDTEKRNAIIVDLDGTMALHYDEEGNQLRGHFEYDKIDGDLPNTPIIKLVQYAYRCDSSLAVIFLSGREDSCRDKSVTWIRKYGRIFDFSLFMRKTDDHRQDVIIKQEIYYEHIEPHYNVLFALDDRAQVVNMWRSLGITCLQVAEGNF